MISTIEQPTEQWDLIIQPQRGLFDLRLEQLWRYRDLIMLFVWRDFVSVYKQTILGPLWHLVQPLATTITFTVIFGNVAKLSTDGLPKFLFYMAGTVIWSYFSGCLISTSTTFVSNTNIFGKVYFPRLTVPISVLISRFIAFGIQFAFFLFLMGYFALRGSEIRPNWWIAFTPVLLLMMAGQGLGLGIIISSLTTRYRDLSYLVGFGVSLLMYATPVVYPLSSVPARYVPLLVANPMTAIIETFRHAYLGAGVANASYLLYSTIATVVVLFVGIILFNRVERTFMDTV